MVSAQWRETNGRNRQLIRETGQCIKGHSQWRVTLVSCLFLPSVSLHCGCPLIHWPVTHLWVVCSCHYSDRSVYLGHSQWRETNGRNRQLTKLVSVVKGINNEENRNGCCQIAAVYRETKDHKVWVGSSVKKKQKWPHKLANESPKSLAMDNQARLLLSIRITLL